MARCGTCGGGGTVNSARDPLVIGEWSRPLRRVVVVGVGAPEIDGQLGKALYVAGDGVQALLDRGVLTLA